MQFTVRKDQRNQSCVDQRAPKRLVFPYARMMLAALLLDPAPTERADRRTRRRHVADRALASCIRTRASTSSNSIRRCVVVAKRYFDFKPTDHMHVFEQDARVWAKRAASNPKRYDLIMLDAFNGDYIPEHLMTREYLSETRDAAHERRRSRVEYVRDQPPLPQRIGHLRRRLRTVLQSEIDRHARTA